VTGAVDHPTGREDYMALYDVTGTTAADGRATVGCRIRSGPGATRGTCLTDFNALTAATFGTRSPTAMDRAIGRRADSLNSSSLVENDAFDRCPIRAKSRAQVKADARIAIK
jgi:hypothetical protein